MSRPHGLCFLQLQKGPWAEARPLGLRHDLTREDAVFYEENELQDAALSAGSHLGLPSGGLSLVHMH